VLRSGVLEAKASAILLALALIGLSAPACAGLVSAPIRVMTIGPTQGDVLEYGYNSVIDGSVQYPSGTFPDFHSMSVQVTASQVFVSFQYTSYFVVQPFNGIEITLLSGSFTGASVDGASAFDPVAISVTGSNLFLNYEGVSFISGTKSVVDISGDSAAAPEPASAVFLSLGLIAMGAVGRTWSARNQSARVG
jgi:hypothetical protein